MWWAWLVEYPSLDWIVHLALGCNLHCIQEAGVLIDEDDPCSGSGQSDHAFGELLRAAFASIDKEGLDVIKT